MCYYQPILEIFESALSAQKGLQVDVHFQGPEFIKKTG